ncbi:MAG: undecaprenyl-diphosphate phosphatase [Defluviitaleaceae bacterium]|nr:undecaprenyl-diphosphate phosphatase [Defluviitaleaceae bacterium]
MTIIQAIILGVTQGLAEFLPISSSGHLVLLKNFFDIDEGALTFTVLLHIATLIPVFIVFWKDIVEILKNPFSRYTYLLIAGTIPAVIVALLLGDMIENLFQGGIFLAIGFFLTGIFLLYADTVGAKGGDKTTKTMSYIDALVIGIMQAVAIAPGISRSGSTITGALSRKLDRSSAARFSFLLSIPAILGGAVLELIGIATGSVDIGHFELLPTIVGFIAAMISGYFAIRVMLKLIKSCKLRYFSYYVFALGAALSIDMIMG